MKIDYDFLKKLLLTMEENDAHTISNSALAESVGLDLNKIDDALFDKLVGHLRLLQDNGCIDSKSLTLGFSQGANGHWLIQHAQYRLTNRGYEFIDLLKEKGVFSKIKNLSLSMAFDVGKAVLVNLATGAVK